jgi:hypothetical protein
MMMGRVSAVVSLSFMHNTFQPWTAKPAKCMGRGQYEERKRRRASTSRPREFERTAGPRLDRAAAGLNFDGPACEMAGTSRPPCRMELWITSDRPHDGHTLDQFTPAPRRRRWPPVPETSGMTVACPGSKSRPVVSLMMEIHPQNAHDLGYGNWRARRCRSMRSTTFVPTVR